MYTPGSEQVSMQMDMINFSKDKHPAKSDTKTPYIFAMN